MAFAKLKPITRERAAKELTWMILVERNPMGCNCKPDRDCPWCREYPRIHKRVIKLLNRLHDSKGG